MRWFILAILLISCHHTEIVILNPWQDAYVEEDNIGANHGSDSVLVVGISTYPRKNQDYLAFEIDTIPADAEIIRAELSLYCVDVYNNNGHKFNIYRPVQGWKEMDINWNNKPDPAPGIDFPYAKITVSGAGRAYVWDVTTLVEGWQRGDYYNTGIVIIDDQERIGTNNTSYKIFSSREGDHPPELRIEYR